MLESIVPYKAMLRGSFLCLFAFLFSFGVFAQPTITSFTPGSGSIGTSVTVTGTNFSSTPSNNIVFFGGMKATVQTATTTSLTVTVPAGATYQPITVTTNNLTAFSNKPFTVTFSGAAPQFTPYSFEYAARVDSVSSDIETTKYTIADIDDDGKLDVITVDRLNNTVSIYKNTTTAAAISFAPKIDFITGQSPRAVATGDIDGDGKLDIVVSNLNDNTVSIFKNTTSGGIISFATRIDFATATQPSGISITDFDNDGKADLAINTINFEGYISLLRNTSSGGTISFAPRIDLQSAGGSIEEIRTADVDGDGRKDIVIPNYSFSVLNIFRNTSSPGNISFAPKIDISTFTNPDDIEIGDLDGDGKLDIAVGHYLNPAVAILRNASTVGSIVFQPNSSCYGTVAPSGLTINDLDGDGKPDLVVNEGLESFSLFKNNSSSGSITFYPGVKTPALYNSNVLSGDFDGDGKTDLAFNRGVFRVTVWKNKTTGPYISSFSPQSAGTGTTVTIQGGNFSGVTSVSFGGVPASSFTIVNSTTITAVVGAGASGAVSLSAPYGTAQSNGFVFAGPPVVFSFTPVSATTGDTIRITGQNFNAATAVSFGGTAATSFRILSPGYIEAVVDTGSSGNASITTSYGTGTLAGFTYLPIPKILSFTPTAAATGDTIIISGINFSSATVVSFGGIAAASFTIINPTTINAVIGNGASGNVSVSNSFGTGNLAGFTYVPPPIVSSFTPASASTGRTITITGTNFTGTTSVKFGGISAESFNIVSPTTITAVVGVGTSGDVTVTSPSGTGNLNGFIFLPPPSITSFFPTSGPIGTSVTITGSNFSSVAANNIVYFGSVKAQVVSASANSLTVLVPPSSSYRRISVTVDNLTALSDKPFIVIFNGGTSDFSTTSFSSSVNFPGSSSGALIVVSDDLDGDGKPEAIFPDYYSIGILRNTSANGLVSFAPKLNFAASWYTYYLTTNDFNGDGKKDIAVTNGDGNISVFINTSTVGSISFARTDIYTGVTGGFGIVSEDIDVDGRMDLEVVIGGTIVILLNKTPINGQVSFSGAFTFSVGPTNVSALPMRFVDVDNDHKPDLIFAGLKVAVYRNTSSGETVSFDAAVEFPAAEANTWLAVGDLDGDDKPDIVTNSNTSSATILRNLSTPGNISFAPKIDIGNYKAAEDVHIADMNGDGKADIIVVPQAPLAAPPPPRLTSIFKNNSTSGNISFASSNDYLNSASFNAHVLSVIDDFNGDGRLDIGSTINGFSVMLNQVGGSAIASFSPTSGPAGTTVTITGNNLTGATNVSFGGVPAASFSVVNSTTISAIVGTGATGNVSVITPGGTTVLDGFTFIPAPTITSFTPTNNGSGSSITIVGTNFTGATAVSFGGTPAASFTVNSSTSITAVLGNGASGDITVATPGGTASMSGFIFNTVTGIFDPGNVNSIELTVRPNPTRSWLMINHPSTNKNATLRFIDIMGRQVKILHPSRFSHTTNTNVNDLAPGVYTIIWNDGIQFLNRVVVVE